jgi:glycosyltransferase involved in cell wall biosynthesis
MKLVIQSMSRVWGGNEKWFATVAMGLIERGHEVVVSCPNGPVRDRLRRLGLRTSGFRPRGVIDPVSGLSFAGWLRREKPDAVLATSWHSIVWVTAAARAVGVERIVVRLGILRSAPRGTPKGLAFRKSVDALIVNSPEIRDEWLRTAEGFSADRIYLILNGVEQRAFDRGAAAAELRSLVQLPDGAMVVGGAGNISERKGFDITLRALALVNNKNLHLVVIGDGPYRQNLVELSRELMISDRVHWLGRRDNAAELIAGCDLFVLSSRNEGMANVMLEAMASGTPVIGADVSGVRLAIGATGNRPRAGWVVPADDPLSLSKALDLLASKLSSGSDDIRARTDEARWRIENWFEPNRMIDESEAAIFNLRAPRNGVVG